MARLIDQERKHGEAKRRHGTSDCDFGKRGPRPLSRDELFYSLSNRSVRSAFPANNKYCLVRWAVVACPLRCPPRVGSSDRHEIRDLEIGPSLHSRRILHAPFVTPSRTVSGEIAPILPAPGALLGATAIAEEALPTRRDHSVRGARGSESSGRSHGQFNDANCDFDRRGMSQATQAKSVSRNCRAEVLSCHFVAIGAMSTSSTFLVSPKTIVHAPR